MRPLLPRNRQREFDEILRVGAEKLDEIDCDIHGDLLRGAGLEGDFAVEHARDRLAVFEKERPVELQHARRNGVVGGVFRAHEERERQRQFAAGDGVGEAQQVRRAEVVVAAHALQIHAREERLRDAVEVELHIFERCHLLERRAGREGEAAGENGENEWENAAHVRERLENGG